MGLKEMLFGKHGKREKGAIIVMPDEISCDSEKLEELIVRWTKNEGWDVKTFVTIMERLSVKSPLYLGNLNANNNSFDCVSSDGEAVRVSLHFGVFPDFMSEVLISKGRQTECYEVWTQTDNPKAIIIQQQGRVIQQDNKKLESYYCEYDCQRKLYIGNDHALRVEINKPAGQEGGDKILRNAEAIEEFLLRLEEPILAQGVYDVVTKMMGFTEEDIQSSDRIFIAYVDINDKTEECRSLVYLRKGQMQEYAVLEDNKTFLVCRNGNWRYISDCARISYEAEKGKCRVVFSDLSVEEMKDLKVAQLTESVEARISQLQEYVK